MDTLNTSTLLDVSELLSTISANILLDLPVFCEDTTEPYFRAPASFLPIRERREETLQNSVPLLQLPGSIIREILRTLPAQNAVSLGRSCRQLHTTIFGPEGEGYWKHKIEEIKPSESDSPGFIYIFVYICQLDRSLQGYDRMSYFLDFLS